MTKKQDMKLDYAFFNLMRDYYEYNKGKIKRNYSDLTRKFLNYNDKNINPDAYLRRPQFEALEMYVFIKEFFNNYDVASIFKDYMEHKGYFSDESFYASPIHKSGQLTFLDIGAEQNSALFKEMKKVSEGYPNYIYALTMGLGKTVLMATCIFYEFLVASKNPKDKRFCHNAIVFAPDKTVLETLRDIVTIDKNLVVPPEYARVLDTNIKVHFLEDTGTTLNTLDNSDFNIIISNTQKIIVKQKHKEDTPTTKLFSLTKSSEQDEVTSEYLIYNQRLKKLCRLKQLGIYVDEAHHLFGKDLEKSLRTSLRRTINYIATELEKSGTSVVACYNYTGTPYVKNKILPEVVYCYGLKNAIAMHYLKDIDILRGYDNVKDKEFLKDAITTFWNKYQDKTFEGLLPKMAIFSTRIEEVTDVVKPAVEEICDELGIPRSKILVNVGDTTITKDEAIRDFNNLDVVGTAGSQKQIILLVDKGREGWNCRSLFSVAMFRSPKTKVFVLQATMRCLRQITDEQQGAMVFLSKSNLDILDDELRENFSMTIDDLSSKRENDSKPQEVRVLPPPRCFTIKTIHHKIYLAEKEYNKPIDFGLTGFDYSKYKATIYEKRGLVADTILKEQNADNIRETRKFSLFMLVGEIAKYLNIKCSLVARIIEECIDGVDLLMDTINLYNDALYDIVIPKIFHTIWDEKVEKITEERKLVLLRQPKDKECYKISGKPGLVVKINDIEVAQYKERSFHADTYCFDSRSEKECFYQYIMNTELVKSIYFTGMFTANQGDLSIPYYDPDTKRMRNYYPDFFAEMQDGRIQLIEVKSDDKIDDIVVKAKASAAQEIAAESEMEYVIYKSSELLSKNVLVDGVTL